MAEQQQYTPEVQVEDGEFYGGSGSLGIREISLEQYRRCCIEGSKEMVKAGKQERVVKGQVFILDIPDQREIFSNSVKMMEIVLFPEIQNNKEIKKKLDLEDKKIDELDQWVEKEVSIAKKFQKIKHPKAGREYDTEGHLQGVEQSYYCRLVEISRNKLAVLSLLLKELNYFEEGGAMV